MNRGNIEKFIQQNSPDGGFLQSEEWRMFQESAGKKTYNISSDNFWANIIEHKLPFVGKYFYVPRGPVIPAKAGIQCENFSLETRSQIKSGMIKLLNLAKKNNVGWIRIEPNFADDFKLIKKNIKCKIKKAPHDMQPREIFAIDISKSEEQLLAEMKSKTRYNVKLAEKKGVSVRIISNYKIQISNQVQNKNDENIKKYIDEFVRLTQVMAERQGIVTHKKDYYRKMIENMPENILKLYVAEYDGKVIAANLVVFYPHTKTTDEKFNDREEVSGQKNNNFGAGVYGRTCTYLHGASDDSLRNVMAPFLLQWQQIKDAKAAGCTKYDFGGVKINLTGGRSWAGVTRFKTGFSPSTKSTEFPGCYDIIINPVRYWAYRAIQKMKSIV